jgi:hypothetical protein
MAEAEKPRIPGAGMYFIGAGVAVLLIWGWFLLEHFTNLRIVRSGQEAGAASLPVAFPLVVTPLAFIIATILWRRAVGIVENGVPASATVKSVGGEFQGYREVSFDYTFEGASYSKKMSVIGVTAEKLNPGDALPIIVDKRNPKRVVVK